MDPYALIAQYPNAGESFANTFQQGQQRNALAGFAQNPGDPNALAAAAQYDPGAVLQYREQQQAMAAKQGELTQQQLQDWHKYAGELAKWADTAEKWDQAVDYLAASGHPEVAQLKGQFSPAMRAQFMALGGVQDDRPQIITPQPGGGAFMLDSNGHPVPLVLPNDGSQATGAPSMPTVSTPQEAAKLPPGTQFRMPDGRIGTVPGNGGQTAPAPSGGFRP
jgi:hypothetical protein